MKLRFVALCTSGFLVACQAQGVARERIEVSIADLVAAYDANEAAAQARFDGKDLLVSARVDQVNLDRDDKPFVNLAADNVLLPVQLHFAPGSEASAATLIKGQDYRFLCDKVSEIMGSPMLDRCRIAQ